MKTSEIETLFAKKIMEIMDETLGMVLTYNSYGFDKGKFECIKNLSSLTAELLKKKDIHDKMIEIAKKSNINGDNIEDKFATFTMIRNVIHHYPIFDRWEDIYITKDLLEWNGSKGDQIKGYFKKEREFSYKIFLKENNEWVPKHEINIRTPKLGKNNKIYLKDILSLDDAIWTFAAIDYYLQFLGLNITARYLASL